MKKSALILSAFIALLASLNTARAQDPEFTQFYANPLYLNPAFAGAQRCPRVIMNYRNQWPALTGQFVTTSVSYDQFICHIGGVGALFANDKAGEGTLVTNNFSLFYAKPIQITRFFSISMGFQATYAEKRVDWDKLTFGDMIDPRRGFVNPTQEVPGRGISRYFDMSAGILGYSKTLFFGFAVNHLTEPDEYLQVGPSPLPRKYTGHAGAMIPVGNGDTYISPNLLYQAQQDFRQLNMGMYVMRGPITGGLWYRDKDAFIVLIGFQQGSFKAGYSYDVTVSRLANKSSGSHELSFAMQFSCKKCPKRFRPLSCPSF
ncbi:MAG: type IX secretion system membrane protein PorP/SprF [Bacteroidota bacterium]